MATPAVVDYREASYFLLAQAREELQAGDLRQASEKGWGAAAQIIKAVAEDRGRAHYAHYLLIRMVSDLIEETGDEQLHELLDAAQSLHTNFYENWLTRFLVENRVTRMEQLVRKLQVMISD